LDASNRFIRIEPRKDEQPGGNDGGTPDALSAVNRHRFSRRQGGVESMQQVERSRARLGDAAIGDRE